MYDILQLNDMLVPELLDVADQLKIAGAKKLDKQQLIYKILDNQAVMASENKGADDKKRKRIVKTTTASGTEEAVVESGEKETAPKPARKKKDDAAAAPAPKKVL
jgi:transcription termination factor Rho